MGVAPGINKVFEVLLSLDATRAAVADVLDYHETMDIITDIQRRTIDPGLYVIRFKVRSFDGIPLGDYGKCEGAEIRLRILGSAITRMELSEWYYDTPEKSGRYADFFEAFLKEIHEAGVLLIPVERNSGYYSYDNTPIKTLDNFDWRMGVTLPCPFEVVHAAITYFHDPKIISQTPGRTVFAVIHRAEYPDEDSYGEFGTLELRKVSDSACYLEACIDYPRADEVRKMRPPDWLKNEVSMLNDRRAIAYVRQIIARSMIETTLITLQAQGSIREMPAIKAVQG
jgi:hypothetical protein